MLKKIMLSSCLALSMAGIALPGIAMAAPRVEVTRFHLDNPARSGTIAVEEMPGNPDVSLEFRTYAGTVERELQGVGFTPAATGAPSDYVARVALQRSFRPSGIGTDKPVSMAVGGGIGSRGSSGLGLGIGIDLSGKPKDFVTTQMQVQIRRRSDSEAIWEGRATTQALENKPEAQPAAAAAKLASALFGGYPGESGRTIVVK